MASMNKFSIALTLCVTLNSACWAINLPLTSNYLEVEVATDYDIKTAGFPGSMEAMAYESLRTAYSRAHITYEGINIAREATFAFEVNLQGDSLGTKACTTGSLSLYLDEPVLYSIDGALDCSTDIPSVDFHGYWTLFNGEAGDYYYSEDQWAQDTAHLRADDFVDPLGPLFPNNLTGIIPPGVYSFIFQAKFDPRRAPNATVNVAGFTTLTLLRLVPEPSSSTLVAILFGSALTGSRVFRVKV